MKYRIRLLSTSLFIVCFGVAVGQVPFVKSLSKNSAGSQETISIQGVNFGTNAGNIKVNFGSVSVSPLTITDQLIVVKVPTGTIYENVEVINTSTGLSGYSKDPFLLSFGGPNPFDKTQLVGQTDFASESGLYDLTIADFDGDGKSDIATANDGSTNIAVFLNTSTPGSVSFTKSLLTPGVISLHVSSGDLNGDGKPELILSEKDGAHLFIFKNNSTVGSISFAMQTITIAGAKLSQSRVSDIDMNGKSDIVITDQSSGRFFMLPNQSSLSTIQFAAPIPITTSGLSTDGIAVGDLDGDSFPEIVVVELHNQTGIISIFKNLSSPGNLNLAPSSDINSATDIANLRIGDLDGDAKPDLAATGFLASGVLVFANHCTSSLIQFADPAFVNTSPNPQINSNPYGIDFGDVDGDGKTDMLVGSITQQSISVLNNQSTPGNFNFQPQDITAIYPNRDVQIGDIDGDGRPDLVFTSIDFQGVTASKVSIFRNANCVLPKLTPLGPLTICNGLTQRIEATANPGATYEWFKDGASLGAPGPNSFLDITTGSGAYTVKLVNGSCSKTSASSVQVNVISGASLSTATPNPVTPVCIGGVLTLSVNDVSASDYVWTGPGAFTAHGLTATRTGFQTDQAGIYTLEVMVGSCVQQRATVAVDVVDIPGVTVEFSGSDIICSGQTKQFTVFPSVANYTYQWSELTSGDISGATNSTFTANATGKYLVKLKSTINTSCAAIQTAAKKVRIAQTPVVNFTLPTSACTSQVINFTDQSTIDNDPEDTEVDYSWDFGDLASAATKDATHFFTTPQSFTVKHIVTYRNQSCPAFKTASILIQSAPAAAITTPSGIFSFCPGDNLLLQVTGTFNSYLWNTGDATSSTLAKQGGSFSVDLTSGSCKITLSKVVTQFPAPLVTATADPKTINEGHSSQLNATGLTAYLWRPNLANISDSLIFNPVVYPKLTTTYTVLGKDANGCNGSATVDITVIPDKSLNGLIPEKFFSPNADGINDVWKVENAPVSNTCAVSIYDERGLKIFEAKPYLNNWDGTSSQGKVLPAGVYYYVIKCDDSPGNFKGGSINIIR